MSKKYNSINVISFPYEENCGMIKKYLNNCGLDCQIEKIYPPSGTVNSRHNWGCTIHYNKTVNNEEIINTYLEENSYINRFINKFK